MPRSVPQAVSGPGRKQNDGTLLGLRARASAVILKLNCESEDTMQGKPIPPPTITLYPRLWSWQNFLSILLGFAGMVFPASAFAAPQSEGPISIDKHVRYVNCGSSNTLFNSINKALATLDPSEDNTVYVNGACQENVTITGFDRLKLIAQNGASINDASGGTVTVVSITDSLRVSLQGFTINGNGGPNDQQGVLECITSNCFFSGNTFQNSGDSGANVVRGAHAYFNGDVFDSTGGPGLFVGNGAYVLATGVTAQRNDTGVSVFASTLQILNSTVQNNTLAGILAGVNSTANIGHTTITGNAGDGIQVTDDGTANVSQTTITGNGGDGIGVIDHSTLRLRAARPIGGNSITGNLGAGILIKDLSFALFSAPASTPNVVTGNGGVGGKDVLCSPQFPATRGVAG